MTNVKNKGNPIYIGKALCQRNQVTPVSKNDLKNYLKTPSGAFLLNVTLFVIDDDFEKQQKVEREAVKAAAIAEAKKLILPEVTAEIEDRMTRKYEKIIAGLQKRILAFSPKPEVLESELQDLAPPKTASGDDDGPETGKLEAFVFDPDKHALEHRGRGKYYVMDGEIKIYGPVTVEEKAKFEALIGE